MSDSTNTEDTVIRIAALKAAKDAAEHMAKSTAPKHHSSVGAFALYTWGALAFGSALFAVVMGINPDNLMLQPTTIAKVEKLWDQTVAEVKGFVATQDPIRMANAPETDSSPASVQVAKAEPKPPAVNLSHSTAELPKIELPKIELPDPGIVNKLALQDLDRLSTGSINPSAEDGLQPFPDDEQPQEQFAVDIGGAKSVTPLVGRFVALKRRAPDLFFELEPRIQLKGEDANLEARLIAGPFTSRGDVAQFCRSLRLRLTIDCTLSTFEGEVIR